MSRYRRLIRATRPSPIASGAPNEPTTAPVLYESKDEAHKAYRQAPAEFFERYHEQYFNERELISPEWTWYETRYHYNLVENGIIDILRRHAPRVRGNSVLDVGAGTGHWIDFFHHVLESEVTAVDFSSLSVERLKQRHRGDSSVEVLKLDISEPEASLHGRFDVINAIGVMFHIVDDDRWRRAVANLCGYLRSGGVAIVGGEFGSRTEDLGVMRRVRSLAEWDAAIGRAGAERVALERFDWFKGGVNPGLKNNLMAFLAR